MTQYILHGSPHNTRITDDNHDGRTVVEWKQGINNNTQSLWHIEARVFLAKDGTVLSIYQIILLEPMCDSFLIVESEHEQFLATIQQILQQKAA